MAERYVACPTCGGWARVNDSDVGTEVRRQMLEATSTLYVYAHCPRCRVSFTSPDLPVTFDRQE